MNENSAETAQKRRQKILKTTLDLFVPKGYAQTKVDDIPKGLV